MFDGQLYRQIDGIAMGNTQGQFLLIFLCVHIKEDGSMNARLNLTIIDAMYLFSIIMTTYPT